ncbi:tail fiber domain-containing protein [Sulfurovum sp. CS9]|uniref:tail fiber domain-containing protein n=1 Tax=Sulfurovum sp. CS9 TaxID=3391146 RepID=UPI0039EA5F9E
MKKYRTLSIVAVIALINSSVLYGGSEADSNENVYYGYGAGTNLDYGIGMYNVFMGYNAGHNTTNGDLNIFIGYESGSGNTWGNKNTFIGYESGRNNTSGNKNTFSGCWSGISNTTGSWNTFSGFQSGFNNTTGHSNTFSGYFSGFYNITGHQNTFIGSDCGRLNTIGSFNTFIGDGCGTSNKTGDNNTFIGQVSGFDNTEGSYNTFNGVQSGSGNTTGNSNTFSGYESGYTNTTGNNNTFLGRQSGFLADVDSSVFLGYMAGFSADRDNTLYISNSLTEFPLIYGEFDTKMLRVNGKLEGTWAGSNTEGDGLTNLLVLSANNSEADKVSDAGFALKNARRNKQWNFRTHQGGDAFVATLAGTGGPEFSIINDSPFVDEMMLYLGNGAKCINGVWINSSSRTSKENIKVLSSEDALAAFRKLQPVTYNYKTDKTESYVGFIAEDVPELVAIQSRDGLSSMDMVAVLTKVVQETRAEAEAKDQKIAMMDARQKAQEEKIAKLESILTNLALDTSYTKKEKVSINLK